MEYIREKKRFSPCSVNEYWYIYIRYDDKTITRLLNKMGYSCQEAIEVVHKIIQEHGTPPPQRARRPMSDDYHKKLRIQSSA